MQKDVVKVFFLYFDKTFIGEILIKRVNLQSF